MAIGCSFPHGIRATDMPQPDTCVAAARSRLLIARIYPEGERRVSRGAARGGFARRRRVSLCLGWFLAALGMISATAISRISPRAEQQRDVVVLLAVIHI